MKKVLEKFNNKKIISFFIAFIMIIGVVAITNKQIREQLKISLKEKLTQIQNKMKKNTNNVLYYDASKVKINCKGFFKYNCEIKNNYLKMNNMLMNGEFATWNIKIDNISLANLKELEKGNIKNLSLEINNIKPTNKASVLFAKNIYNYIFPFNIKNNFSLKKKKNNIKEFFFKKSYIEFPAFKIEYYGHFSIENTPNGFYIYLDKNNKYIKKPKDSNAFKAEVHLVSSNKIILYKTGYVLHNKNIDKMLYGWYENIGSKKGFGKLNKTIFYINRYKKLTFQEFNKMVISIFNKAINDAKKIKNKNINWYIQYLTGLKKLYLHKIKALKVEIVNKKGIPLQALYIEGRLYPGMKNQVSFIGEYYDVKIIEINNK